MEAINISLNKLAKYLTLLAFNLSFAVVDGHAFTYQTSISVSKDGNHTTRVVKQNNESYTYKSSDTFTSFEVKSKGDIKITDDDRDVKSITPGGYLKIYKKTFGNKRALVIESNASGQLDKQYFENKKELAFEPEGRKFMDDVLLDVIRSAGLDAENRAKRIYKKGGVDAVLDEIEEISSNSGKGRYFDYLLQQNNLATTDLIDIIEEATEEISSSSTKGSLFRKYSKLYLGNEQSGVAYLKNLSKLSSNTERGSVLRAVIPQIPHSEEVTYTFFDCVDKLSSSSEKGSVMRAFLEKRQLSSNVRIRLFESVGKVSSSSESGSILRRSIDLVNNNEGVYSTFFDITEKISSSSEKGSVLRKVATSENVGEPAIIKLLEVAQTISSNSEKGSVLRTVAGKSRLSERTWIELLEVTSTLSSSSEKGSVLMKIREGMPSNNESLRQAFMNSAESLTSDSEFRRVTKGWYRD